MKKAQLIIVKLNTVSRVTNEFEGPINVESETTFKPIIQQYFDTTLKGISGYVLVLFEGKLYQCERDNVNPDKPYVRHEIKYHPLAERFNQ